MATERVDVGSLRLERPAASPLHLGKNPLDIFCLRTVFPKGKLHENKGQAPTVLKKQTAQLHRERRQSPSGTDRNEGKMEAVLRPAAEPSPRSPGITWFNPTLCVCLFRGNPLLGLMYFSLRRKTE